MSEDKQIYVLTTRARLRAIEKELRHSHIQGECLAFYEDVAVSLGIITRRPRHTALASSLCPVDDAKSTAPQTRLTERSSTPARARG